jgi:hypothetical protein
MTLQIGNDILEPVYYERKGFWYISRNGRETIYSEDREWVTFETEKEAEEYLRQNYGSYEKVP